MYTRSKSEYFLFPIAPCLLIAPCPGMSQELWELVPDYLAILRCVGDVYMLTGSLKYARTHYKEGLQLAQTCALQAWWV